jgi:hypothetical protein
MKTYVFHFHSLLLSLTAPIIIYVISFQAKVFSHFQDIWRMVFICIVITSVLAVLCFFLAKDHSKSAFVTSILILAILYPPHLFWVLFGSIGLAWGLLAFSGKKFDIIHGNISLLFISLCVAVYTLIQFTNIQKNMPWAVDQNMLPPISISLQTNHPNKPDIYYIIPDGYGSQSMLQKIHGYDNSEFIQELESRGFVVAPESKSNYHRSILSISSTLNMQYLDSLYDTFGDSNLWWPMMGAFSQNHAQEILKTQGYKTVSVASGGDFTTLTNSDYYRQTHLITLNKFEHLYIYHSALSYLGVFDWGSSISFPNHSMHRKVVLYAFEQLHEIPDIPGPKFVFVHIISPHAPFIFDAQGNYVTPEYPFTFADDREFLGTPSEHREGYLGQLQFVNTQILAAVDAIREKSPHPPIIIIQGDHGPSVFVDYHSAERACLQERYSILNAYHFPGVSPEEIPEDISPVNTFRFIFNHYFDAELEILPNRHYFSPASSMYEFIDISRQIDHPCTLAE